MPALKELMRLEIQLAPRPVLKPTPQGLRRVSSVVGGRFEGERLRGTVLPGGADWSLARSDGIMNLWGRYSLRTEEGTMLTLSMEGVLCAASADLFQRLEAGEPVNAEAWHGRSTLGFGHCAPAYRWLRDRILVGASRAPSCAQHHLIDVFEVR